MPESVPVGLSVTPGGVTVVTVPQTHGLAARNPLRPYADQALKSVAHVLLPSEGLSRDKENRAKFPGSAVPLLLEEMKKLGARGPFTAKIAGGSSMFGTLMPSGDWLTWSTDPSTYG